MALPVFPLLKVTFPHYAIMEGLFRKGLTANVVQTFMSKMGMGYRRSTVQAVRRKVMSVLKFESYYRTLPSDRRPSPYRIPELVWNRHEKYKVMYSFDVLDSATGETKTYRGSHYTNSFLSKSEYAKEIQDELDPDRYLEHGTITYVAITQVTHREGYGY